jgi:hypothetical protein
MAWLIPVALSLVCVSLICEILIIYGYTKIPQLRKYPGQYILIQSIAQLYIDIHWVTITKPVQKILDDTTCRLIGAINYYAYTIAWCYTVFLSLEVSLKVISSVSSDYSKRNRIYHGVAQLLSIICFIILASSNTNGRSGLGTCSIQAGTVFELLWVIHVAVFMPICIVFVVLSYIHSKRQNIQLKSGIKYHALVVLGFVFTVTPAEMFDAVNWGDTEFHDDIENSWAICVSKI